MYGSLKGELPIISFEPSDLKTSAEDKIIYQNNILYYGFKVAVKLNVLISNETCFIIWPIKKLLFQEIEKKVQSKELHISDTIRSKENQQ